MIDDESRAQRWHDTDHGRERPPARKTNRYHVLAETTEPYWVSSCWCCCELCDPDWQIPRYGGIRPNPFWTRATNNMTA